MKIGLRLLPETMAVCKLTEAELPSWAQASALVAFTKTDSETSLVCAQHCVPPEIKAERDWRALVIDGVLDFSLIGIIAPIASLFAANAISIFVISTYDTDYILLRSAKLVDATDLLRNNGYMVIF
jgi:hypothetical protein